LHNIHPVKSVHDWHLSVVELRKKFAEQEIHTEPLIQFWHPNKTLLHY